MKLVYKDPGFIYSTKSIAEFIKQGEFWSEPIYHFFPELLIYKDLFNRDMENSLIEEKIMSSIEKLYIVRKEEISNKKISYQKAWDEYEDLINHKFSSIFGFDTFRIFDNLVCNITLNPISPRFLEDCIFDTFYLNSEKGAMGVALHEITHYLWFFTWNKKYNDDHKTYESPSLKWILSEAVVEQILNNEEFNNINPYHKTGVAYPYFYNMEVRGKQLYDYLNEFYRNNDIVGFMDNSYDFFLKNEEEIRSQIE